MQINKTLAEEKTAYTRKETHIANEQNKGACKWKKNTSAYENEYLHVKKTHMQTKNGFAYEKKKTFLQRKKN